ncbi:MAG: TlpA family protein disulfide reductase [Dysgonamonadaceae bacterium]|jgi:thiol-disulfide isomerase/thioredoxin|nr:TlpA family protein disulfide reductase [Dysgonamonadaceae bacterium]
MKTYLTIFFFLISGIAVSAQNTIIKFAADTLVSVGIYEPIDGNSNLAIETQKLVIKPDTIITYKFELVDFGFINLEFSNKSRCDVLMEKGDTLEIRLKNNKITFYGNNAAGNQYLYDNYVSKGWAHQQPTVDYIVKNNTSEKINFDGIYKAFKDSCFAFINDLDELYKRKEITSSFNNIMKQNLNLVSYDLLFQSYSNLLYGFLIKEFKPDSSDKYILTRKIEEIIDDGSDYNIRIRCRYFFPTEYCYLIYRISKERREEINAEYDANIFGSKIPIMLAPEYMHAQLLGKELLYKTVNLPNEFNYNMLNYMISHYPNSAYTLYLQNWANKKESEDLFSIKKNNATIIDNNKINSLKDLSLQEGIKGNYIFVDLWATWCAPCKHEFKNNEELHKLFSQYKNIVTVYISIDKPDRKEIWRKDVDYYNLEGFNLIASENLYKDIQLKLNGKIQAVGIPRYILLDSNGNIVNDDLPRPSSLAELKAVLDNLVK